MKTKLIELLTTKFGVGAKVVEGIAEKLSKTVATEEEAATAVEGVSFQQVLESYADKRANEASETARKNAINAYEKQYGLKDGKTVEDPAAAAAKAAEEAAKKAAAEEAAKKAAAAAGQTTTQTTQQTEEVPQYIKDIQAANAAMQQQNAAMLETIKALQGKISGMETAKTVENRQSILQKEIGKLTASQQKPYNRIALDSMSDEDFNSFMEETRASVVEIQKENAAAAAAAGAGRPFVGNVPTNGKKASDAEIAEVVGKIA